LLSDVQNDKINKFNFALEVILTLSIFFSSFLIISVEKDWWGTQAVEDTDSLRVDPPWMKKIKDKFKPSELQVICNVLRLQVIGWSIAFFIQVILLELSQSCFTCKSVILVRFQECIQRIKALFVGD